MSFYSKFIEEQDYTPVALALLMYKRPPQYFAGYEMLPGGSDRVRAWKNGDTVLICCKGTSVTSFSDIGDDLVLAQGGGCSLSLVVEASELVEMYAKDTKLIVAGHSLGGAAAFCLAKKYPVSRAISLNGAAPPVGGPHTGSGNNCIFYHIVGDIISTHAENCMVKRIKLPGQVDWSNPAYYHSSERFFGISIYEEWTAQQEQDSMTWYAYNSTATSSFVSYLAGVVSKRVSRDRIRELVCKNPIPGSEPSGDCLIDYSIPFHVDRILATFAGGFLGFLLGNPVAGALAGYDLSTGEGVLDQFITGKIFKGADYFKGDIVRKSRQMYRQIV